MRKPRKCCRHRKSGQTQVVCVTRDYDLKLKKRTVPPVLAAVSGDKPRRPAWIRHAFHPRKGKPVERRRRKAMGLRRERRWLPGCRRDGQVKNPSVPGRSSGNRMPRKSDRPPRILGLAPRQLRPGLSRFFLSSFPRHCADGIPIPSRRIHTDLDRQVASLQPQLSE